MSLTVSMVPQVASPAWKRRGQRGKFVGWEFLFMRIVAVTIVGLLLATAYPALAEPVDSPPVDLKPTLTPPKPALAERAAHRVRVARSGQPARDRIRPASVRDDGFKQRVNSWTIGL